MSRFARRKDATHRPIVDTFEAMGCSWLTIEGIAGAPDGALGCNGRTHLIEIKDGTKVPSKRKLSEEQVSFAAGWRGGPVHVIASTGAAVDLVNLLRMAGR